MDSIPYCLNMLCEQPFWLRQCIIMICVFENMRNMKHLFGGQGFAPPGGKQKGDFRHRHCTVSVS